MLDIEKILFATDLSECANQALPHAIRFAELHQAELHMLHVLVLHGADLPDRSEPYPGEEEARRVLEEASSQAGGRVVHALTRGFSAAPAILEYADDADIDLIVMGSHGRRGVRRMLLGSVAEEVVRTSDRPVLTIRRRKGAEAAEHVEIHRILVPVDFSKHGRQALEYARALAGTYGAEIHLLHSVDIPVYPDFYVPVSISGLDMAKLRERSHERLERLAKESFGVEPDLRVRVDVGVGRPVGEIVEYAESHEIDLIIIPTHGLTGVERALLGSVTSGVIRRAPCSVLTTKPHGRSLVAS